MSTTDGDTPSRLDAALRNVFESAASRSEPSTRSPAAEPDRRDEPTNASDVPVADVPVADVPVADDWSVDGPDEETYELPAIVPATRTPVVGDPMLPTAPRLVDRPRSAGPPPGAAPVTAWGDHMSTLPTNTQAPLRAPGRKPRVRRVTRVLRHIDPWSTFKVALLFSATAYLVSLTAGVLLWRVADNTGTLANVERWFTQFGWETFELDGGEIFRNAWIIGLFGAVALTGALVLLATLFNLVSDIVGGVRMTVLEEEVVERTVSSARRYVVRRTPAASGAGAEDDWDVDGDAHAARADATSGSARSAAAEPTRRLPVAAEDWSIDDDTDDASDTQRVAEAG